MPADFKEIIAIVQRIKLYITYNDKNRSYFADVIGLEKSTIDKIFQKEPFLSYANHKKIKDFLDEDDVNNFRGLGGPAGPISEEAVSNLVGNYMLYSPNSENLGEIEAFGLTIYWDHKNSVAEAEAHGLDGLKVTFNVHLPRNDGRVFLKRSYHGWGVMYVLNPSRGGVMNGVALRMDSLNADKLVWEPVLFPVALKKVPGLKPYESLSPSSEGYEEAYSLIMSAVRGNLSTVAVWQYWEKQMPGNPAGGPTFGKTK